MEPVTVWRNQSLVADGAGNSLAIALGQPGASRNNVGAWNEGHVGDLVIAREVTIGGGHGGGQLGWHHFGIGPADGADVRIIWPGGEVADWHRIEAAQFAIMSNDGSVTDWDPLG